MFSLFKKRERPPSPILRADDSNFETLMRSEPGVAVVDFWAPWCGPCRMMAPILDEVAIEHADKGVRVVKVNVDEAPSTAAVFEIRSIPTLVFFRGGEPVFEMVGMVPKPVLDREIAQLLGELPKQSPATAEADQA